MNKQTWTKEYATADFSERAFARFEWDPERRCWDIPQNYGRITFLSLYSWQAPPDEVARTHCRHPAIHEVIFDFDAPAPGLLEYAQTDATRFVEYLREVYDVQDVGIYFSGAKGFHVVLSAGHLIEGGIEGLGGIDPQIIRALALKLGTGFETFDPSTFDLRRIFRRPLAINRSSGLRKIPLTYTQLRDASITAIRTYATPENTHILPLYDEPSVSSELNATLNGISITTNAELREVRHSLGELFKPALQGGRNVHATELAGLLVKSGLRKDLAMVRAVMQLWNNQNPTPLPPAELDHIVTNVYRRYRDRHEPFHHKKEYS